MCRLLGYFGASVPLDQLLYKPEHSLIVQSYQPREMTAGLLNADGFGVGWYHSQRDVDPFFYKNTLPIWNDINLPSLSRYVESSCVLATVRSATAGIPVDLSNCQPFQSKKILGIHNGFIANFRQTLYRPIREHLSDEAYQSIQGTTDSEHIFALIVHELQASPISLTEAVRRSLELLSKLGEKHGTDFSANLIITDGQQMVAVRYASRDPVPSLYWLRDDLLFPDAVLIASEPLFDSDWIPFRDRSILTIAHDLTIETHDL
ncbi:ergothioneine biosynthesis protein EgtC [Phormidium sp. CLA17]|uniref:ergothioneine biosynthesis protein EgtC n=1 Tax=Leptolyngbya sp. Cla-17 TaxID=2803751 RepID=UPI001490BFD8|nr:ergothioneine biosynthesis protein EgtC [Leptolyngbya sp. Cla-17]MBM0740777.1 ergothioneine biosynthesis protein EgtC [Leptolyngbya sp. Cla-17]